MSSNPTQDVLQGAVLNYVQHGAYPDSEEVASAQLRPSAYPGLLDGLQKAKEKLTREIRQSSRDCASDVDEWITQAKRLQADIERSKETARSIVHEVESAKDVQARVSDASSKIGLLESELAFNETLVDTLQNVGSSNELLQSARQALAHGDVSKALEALQEANLTIARLSLAEDTRIIGLLRSRATEIRTSIEENVLSSWQALVAVDKLGRKVTIKKEMQQPSSINLNDIIDSMSKLNIFESAISQFQRDFESAILSPRFSAKSSRVASALAVKGCTIQAEGTQPNLDTTLALEDAQRLVDYLRHLSLDSKSIILARPPTESMMSKLVLNWLEPSVPTTVMGFQSFDGNVAAINILIESIQKEHWSQCGTLLDFVNGLPRIWLAKRKEASLTAVRNACSRGLKHKKIVVRVEKEMVSRSDVLLHGNHMRADWDAKKSDGNGQDSTTPSNNAINDDVDEDTSAWDVEDDTVAEEQAKEVPREQTGIDEGEAWGWAEDAEGEGNGDASTDNVVKPRLFENEQPLETNGRSAAPQQSGQEVTLSEHYCITGIPDAVLDVIKDVISDADTLNTPEYSSLRIAPARVGLYAIPTLLLAMYRATAAAYYANDPAGNMFIYNDTTRLSDQLSLFLDSQRSETSNKLRLDAEMEAVEGFGRRAYGREMESQRTILRDLLEGAQGFANCTVPPFAAECENAIAITVDRIREISKQWQDVLSPSARLQALGSLLSTVTNKIIVDIEDLSDISEEESKQLRHFCDEVSKLNNLFIREDSSGGSGDMTGIYCPNWFKFQYLAEILESSLADIKYMWTEGELKLEFEAQELVDLIEALFAESEYRRKAIGDIRRSSTAM